MKKHLLTVMLYCITFLSTIQSNAQTTYDIIVAKDGSGHFTTVQAAFNAVPVNSTKRTVIFIKNGIYKELLNLPKDRVNVTLIGESVTGVKLTYDNAAHKTNPATGQTYGTSGSSSTYIYGAGFYAKNISFENTAGKAYGPALAIYINGDKAVFEGCRFLGNQDTVYGGRSRQFFINCYIEGTVDFIFGPSTAVFENCHLHSYGGSAITAASTEQYVRYGYVFRNCKITGASGVATTLGRPWRPYAAVAFLYCDLSSIIKPIGWDNWGNAENEKTARYAEYKNTGAGSSLTSRPAWITRLTDAQAANYTTLNVLKTTYATTPVVDNWNPYTVINQTNTGGVVSGAVYMITAKHSGKALDVYGARTADGTRIDQYTYTGANNQKWKIEDIGGGFYKITAMHSGKSLDVNTGSTASGTSIIQWGYTGAAFQQWKLVPTGDGYFQIVARHSNMCLDVTGSSTANGAYIQQWGCANQDNQKWKIQRITTRVGVESKDESSTDFTIYPNPTEAGTGFTVALESVAETVEVTVHNIHGKLVYQSSAAAQDELHINASLKKGVYVVTVKNGLQELKKRLVVK